MNATTSDRYRLQVATLAESTTATTCSALVARRFRLSIVPSGSFEEAIALVKAGIAQAALVPGAYPSIGKFFMDTELRLVRSFAAEIPAMVLATRPNGSPPFRQVFAHPATKPFWGELNAPVVDAASNDTAAAAVNSEHLACITNATAAKRAGLRILREFRPASPMSWNLFARAAKTDSATRDIISSSPAIQLTVTQPAASLQPTT